MFRGLNILSSPGERPSTTFSRQPPLAKSNLQAKAIVGGTHSHGLNTAKPSNSGQESATSPDDDSSVGITMSKTKRDSNLERSFENAFAKARQSAHASVVQGLDPCRPWYKSVCMPSTCSELFWKGHPIQERVVLACHFYTMQWLEERDTSWRAESITLTRYTPLPQDEDSAQEPELMKAIGAWSLDLNCDRARDAYVSSAKVDTVPASRMGLVDATLRRPLSTDCEKANTSSKTTLGGQCPDEDHDSPTSTDGVGLQQPASGVPIIDIDDQSSDSDTSDDDFSESETDTTDSDVDGLLSPTITSTISQAGYLSGTVSAAGSSFTYDGNAGALNSQATDRGRKTGLEKKNGQKRKRSRDDHDDRGESDDEGDVPLTHIPNAMPLEDTSARLACHFYKLHPEQYSGKKYKLCAHGFKDSKDLRDHHKKKHYGPPYLCSRCYKPFKNILQKAEHERSKVRCKEATEKGPFEEGDILDGTLRRHRFNTMKKPRTTSHEEHWFDVWSILFPRRPFPTTPYIPYDTLAIPYGRITETIGTLARYEILRAPLEARYHMRQLADRIQAALDPRCPRTDDVNSPASETQDTIPADDRIEADRGIGNEQPQYDADSVRQGYGYNVPLPNQMNNPAYTEMPPYAYYSSQGWPFRATELQQDAFRQQNFMAAIENQSNTQGTGMFVRSFGGYDSQQPNLENFAFDMQGRFMQPPGTSNTDNANLQQMQDLQDLQNPFSQPRRRSDMPPTRAPRSYGNNR